LAHLAAPPVAALIFHGFAVGFAHAGTNAAAEDDGVEDAGVEDEDDVELEVATARALVVARIIVLVVIIPHRLDAPRRSAVVIALVDRSIDLSSRVDRSIDISSLVSRSLVSHTHVASRSVASSIASHPSSQPSPLVRVINHIKIPSTWEFDRLR